MSDTGLTVPDMTELPRRYDVTITVDRDGGDHPDPAGFAVAAGQAASARAASIVSAHTASQIISIVTVLAADEPAAVGRLSLLFNLLGFCSGVLSVLSGVSRRVSTALA